MQYTEIFKVVKSENFQKVSFFYSFLIFALNIDCGYTLEPHRQGFNEYAQSMFRGKNTKNRYTPAYPSFAV